MTDHVRVYIPVSAADLGTLSADRELSSPADGRRAFAVTDAVRVSDPGGDQESWEYAALQDAAASAITANDPVVVAAADVPSDGITTGSTGSRVLLRGAVPLPRIASLHVGDDVLSATPTVPDHPGSGIELSWYDTTELDQVADLMSWRECGSGDGNDPINDE